MLNSLNIIDYTADTWKTVKKAKNRHKIKKFPWMEEWTPTDDGPSLTLHEKAMCAGPVNAGKVLKVYHP